jgi:hypothetical protein
MESAAKLLFAKMWEGRIACLLRPRPGGDEEMEPDQIWAASKNKLAKHFYKNMDQDQAISFVFGATFLTGVIFGAVLTFGGFFLVEHSQPDPSAASSAFACPYGVVGNSGEGAAVSPLAKCNPAPASTVITSATCDKWQTMYTIIATTGFATLSDGDFQTSFWASSATAQQAINDTPIFKGSKVQQIGLCEKFRTILPVSTTTPQTQ